MKRFPINKTKITISIVNFAPLLARVQPNVDINDKLIELLEKLLLTPEFKKSILETLEKRKNVEDTLKEFKKDLTEISKAIESNQDIDGKCNFCPGMYGL